MNTKLNFLLVLALLAALVGGSAGPALAQGGITGISPQEGTVGTQVTITGAGFGDQHGEVLLGTDKSKVLAWSDTQITFLVDKPQHPDEYAVTVLLPKKTAEPLTFEAFAIRRPQVTSGDLLLDGVVATVVGEFFGDKKGVLRVGYEVGGEMVVQDPKILDWSMSTIRFELPDELTAGFVLAIRSEVGTGLALMDLVGGVVGSVAPAPGWQGGESWENANGVFYKSLSADDNFYVFSNNRNDGYSDNYRIGASRFTAAENQFFSISPPKGETEVPIQPLVVKDSAGKETMWVFHTGHDWAENTCCESIFYSTYYDNGIQGQWNPTSWKAIPNVGIDEDNRVAPVYDPRNHRISIYYDYDSKLRWFYTDDFGGHWSDDALVTPVVPIKYGQVSAIYWPSATTTALVASTGQVIAVNNGEYRGSISHLTDDYRFPDLVDLGGGTALLYQNYAEGEYYNTPMMAKLIYAKNNNGIWSWSGSTPLVTLPDTGIPLTGYNFRWSPNGGVTKVGDESRLYVFYGVTLWEAYTEESIDRWYLLDKGPLADEDLGPLPEIKPTLFRQVSSGQYHTCAIRGDNVVECWGKNSEGQSNTPGGAFMNVSAGTWHTCGVKTNGTIACWGDDDGGRVSSAPTASGFTQVSVGDWHGCGLKTDGSVDCWGSQDGGRTDDKAGPFKQITTGNWHNCGIRNDNSYVYCWGGEDDGRISGAPVNTPFKSISAGDWHTCGVRTNGTLFCWGNNDANRVSPVPTGNDFIQVSAGNWHNCALRTNGTIICWGSNDDGRVTSAPTSSGFTQIEAGDRHTCALREDGGITCWGNNSDRQSLPPF